jgi:hypothetical protein
MDSWEGNVRIQNITSFVLLPLSQGPTGRNSERATQPHETSSCINEVAEQRESSESIRLKTFPKGKHSIRVDKAFIVI